MSARIHNWNVRVNSTQIELNVCFFINQTCACMYVCEFSMSIWNLYLLHNHQAVLVSTHKLFECMQRVPYLTYIVYSAFGLHISFRFYSRHSRLFSCQCEIEPRFFVSSSLLLMWILMSGVEIVANEISIRWVSIFSQSPKQK